MEAVHRAGVRRRNGEEALGGGWWAGGYVVLFMAAAAAGMATPSAAALYKVGDSAGWTATGNVNYSAWPPPRLFTSATSSVGRPTTNCSVLSPIAAHATGSDAFLLRRTGHRFFLSGAAGHCTFGQKVDIRVPKLPRATAPARPLPMLLLLRRPTGPPTRRRTPRRSRREPAAAPPGARWDGPWRCFAGHWRRRRG
ncbi:unnamed protein product [Spirodela intermedia]|uniref:Phytocyanin domain-containing protein n=1 Tax=Spirodela intermedia TaxID=51605 RepID=A0A7I8IZ83_SPIIN|nr:unnamed protein product [Spirodela intermedia]CAA6662893.1 unnamed protein product [Spirodela intermedia]